jgi:hypothetical protein
MDGKGIPYDGKHRDDRQVNQDDGKYEQNDIMRLFEEALDSVFVSQNRFLPTVATGLPEF